ncbi:MAG: DUF4906 domain-containing protein [Rikenella sp.]|nr:DUF4906 domain-containing protein [Rikenella sp.]
MKRLMIFAVVAVGFGLASCTKSDIQHPETTGRPNELPVTVSLSAEALSQPGSGFTAATKAAAGVENSSLAVSVGGAADTKSTTELTTTDDSKVQNVWAIQFKADGTLLGTPYYTTDIPASSGSSSGIDATYNLSVNLTSNAEAGGKVYFVANTHSPSFFNTENVANEQKLAAVLKTIGTEYKPDGNSGIPMLGVYTGTVNSAAAIGNVNMKRLVAKVILKYKVADSFSGFTVTGVQMRNVSANIAFCGELSTSSVFPAKANGSHIDYPAETVANAADDGGYKKFVWYVPENVRTVVSGITSAGDRVLSKTDGNATYIEIKGDYKSSAKSERATYAILLGDPSTNMGDFNVLRNNVYNVTVDILGTNTSDGRVTVETFDMNNSAIIKPNSGDAGAVTFDIRKVNGNSWTSLPALGASATLRAEILWQDGNVINAGDVTLDKVNGLLTVKSSKTTQGNAVVALYNNTSGGDILWSWHVWVTSYDPNEAGTGVRTANTAYTVSGGQVHTYGEKFMALNPGRVIMDRNLGALSGLYAAPAAADANSFGLFYQWGRKDPLPQWSGEGSTTNQQALTRIMYGADGTSNKTMELGYSSSAGTVQNVDVGTAKTGNNTLQYSIKNPTRFISNASGICDWYTDNADYQDNNLWGDGGPKSAYDPCPKGWRIAPNGTWDDFGTDAYAAPFFYYINGVQQTQSGTPAFVQSARNGRLYQPASGNVKAWYPAPGNRYRGNGQLYYVGQSGYSWSSSASGTNAYYLHFSYSGVTPQNSAYRAYGRQVRCLQE